MNHIKKRRKEFLMKILIISAILILNLAIEALFLSKDRDIFINLQKINQDLSFKDYINSVLFNFIIQILNPLLISLYTFFTIDKYGINFFYKLFFAGATLISLVNMLFQFRLGSIFYYIGLILNFILLIVIAKGERIEGWSMKKNLLMI